MTKIQQHRLTVAIIALLGLAGANVTINKAYAQASCMEGELRLFAGNFAPSGWVFADGRILKFSTVNDRLLSIIGTVYGGDGSTNFALPDLRGRAAIGAGNGPGLTRRSLGSRSGAAETEITKDTIPLHNHTAQTNISLHASSATGNDRTPSLHVLANADNNNIYDGKAPDVALAPTAIVASTKIAHSGGKSSFNNYQLSLGLSYIMCVDGDYPMK